MDPWRSPVVRDSRALRLVTMVLVATWWPGNWSCCQSHGATGGNLDAGATSVEGGGTPMACCAEGPEMLGDATCEDPPRSLAGCGVSCGTGSTDKPRPCCCVDAPSDAATLPLVATLPSLDKHGQAGVDFLMELSPAVAAVVVGDHLPRACRGSPRRAPVSSLLALHCQLTT